MPVKTPMSHTDAAPFLRAALMLLTEGATMLASRDPDSARVLTLLAKVVRGVAEDESTVAEFDGHALAREMALRAGETPPPTLRQLYAELAELRARART